MCCHNLTSPLTFGSTWVGGLCVCVCARAVIRAWSSLCVELFSVAQTEELLVLYVHVMLKFINNLAVLSYWKGPV